MFFTEPHWMYFIMLISLIGQSFYCLASLFSIFIILLFLNQHYWPVFLYNVLLDFSSVINLLFLAQPHRIVFVQSYCFLIDLIGQSSSNIKLSSCYKSIILAQPHRIVFVQSYCFLIDLIGQSSSNIKLSSCYKSIISCSATQNCLCIILNFNQLQWPVF